MNPEKIDKYLYTKNVPTWLVRTVYIFGIATWLPIIFSTVRSAGNDFVSTWIVLPVIAFLSLHYLASFVVALCYKRFDIAGHQKFVTDYWSGTTEPSVDVYLPICGEGLDILRHTWTHVAKLHYHKCKVYVLDDSKDECEDHRAMAEEFGFNYFERPNKGEMKKAGNLKYAYLRTEGELIAILDADFAPYVDFLKELVPYMSQTQNGIIQSPQYFPTDKETHKEGPLAFGGARAQEIFYRIIQVARDRLGGAHCCGTCALYRRVALASIGGFVQMSHSEDAHTGFTLTAAGWNIRYVPVLLSVGASPDDAHAFFHQQHRWCLGNILMMLDKKFWRAKISWKIKFSYSTGFLFYIHQPLVILMTFQLFWVLVFYDQHLSLASGYLFYPHVVWAFLFMFFFYLSPLRWGYLYAILMRAYSYCHAIATVVLGGTVGWIPTNAKHAGVSTAFRQTIIGVSLYFLANIFLIALVIRLKVLHLFNYNYFSVQFWIFYNTSLAGLVLWQMYQTMRRAEVKLQQEKSPEKSLIAERWVLKTAGVYGLCASGIFLLIGYAPSPRYFFSPGTVVAVASVNTNREPASIALTRGFIFRTDNKYGNQAAEVRELQRFLNNHGFPLARSGPGASGEETEIFGHLTQAALLKFQQANKLPPTGFFGPLTRGKVNAIMSQDYAAKQRPKATTPSFLVWNNVR